MVVDCAHGAAYHVAPHVFHELGADVVAIGVKPDGFNINEKKNLAVRGAEARTPISASPSTATPTAC